MRDERLAARGRLGSGQGEWVRAQRGGGVRRDIMRVVPVVFGGFLGTYCGAVLVLFFSSLSSLIPILTSLLFTYSAGPFFRRWLLLFEKGREEKCNC